MTFFVSTDRNNRKFLGIQNAENNDNGISFRVLKQLILSCIFLQSSEQIKSSPFENCVVDVARDEYLKAFTAAGLVHKCKLLLFDKNASSVTVLCFPPASSESFLVTNL